MPKLMLKIFGVELRSQIPDDTRISKKSDFRHALKFRCFGVLKKTEFCTLHSFEVAPMFGSRLNEHIVYAVAQTGGKKKMQP